MEGAFGRLNRALKERKSCVPSCLWNGHQESAYQIFRFDPTTFPMSLIPSLTLPPAGSKKSEVAKKYRANRRTSISDATSTPWQKRNDLGSCFSFSLETDGVRKNPFAEPKVKARQTGTYLAIKR
jgi:hypothetical protein